MKQRRAYFQTREAAWRFYRATRDARPWPAIVGTHEMPITKGFVVMWYE